MNVGGYVSFIRENIWIIRILVFPSDAIFVLGDIFFSADILFGFRHRFQINRGSLAAP